MVQVLGIGGVFFRAKDPAALAQWYQTHLGINPVPNGPDDMPWITQEGVTILSPFDAETDYFPKDRAFMLNFRVADLEAAITALAESGITASDCTQMDGVGKFARIHDPEGNPIELWQPAGP